MAQHMKQDNANINVVQHKRFNQTAGNDREYDFGNI